MLIFIKIDGTTQGHFPVEQIRQMLISGKVTPTHQAFVDGRTYWIQLSQIPELYNANPFSSPNPEPKRKVGFLLGLGIFFMPYIFSWFTLRNGHTTTAKVVSFIWLGMLVLSLAVRPPRDASDSRPASSSSETRQTKDSSSDKITLSKFNQLQMGMSYSETVSVLGKSGTETGGNKFGDIETEVYHWDCGILCRVDLYFTNGKLSQKIQIGLSK